jgi:uncharacterized membrane protein
MTDSISSSGFSPRTAAALAYVAGPLSGGLILLAESRNGDVRFHAWQSIIALGSLVVLIVAGYLLAVLSVIVSVGAVTSVWRRSRGSRFSSSQSCASGKPAAAGDGSCRWRGASRKS